MLALHSNRHAVHGRFTLKDDCERQVWNAVAASWTIDRCSTWAIKKHNLWAKYFTSWRHYGWRLDCKLSYSSSVKRTTQLPMNVRWILILWNGRSWARDVTTFHVRRLAFPLNFPFYLLQHTPLWRSKFRILRIKKTCTYTDKEKELWEFRTQVQSFTGTSHPGASQRPTWGKQELLLIRFGDWVEHTSVAQVEVSGGFLLFVSVSC